MKKSTLSFVIASLIAPIANTSHAAGLIQALIDGTDTTNPAVTGTFFIQGQSGTTYDLDKANDNLTKTQQTVEDDHLTLVKQGNDIDANTQLINDNKTHTDAWIVSVAAGAANKADLDKEVTRATDEDSKHSAAITANASELGDHENRLVDMKADVTQNAAGIADHETRITTLENAPKPTNGLDGKDGVNGIDGKDGAKGNKGDKGDVGAAGLNGADGKDGVNGIDGKDGVNGKDADMTKVNANTKGVADNKSAISVNAAAIDASQKTEAMHFTALQTGVAQNAQEIGAYQQKAAELDTRIAANKATQQKTNQAVAANTAKIADHENRITELEQSNSASFGKLKNEVDDNRKRASAGIAGVAAMANIPQVIQGQTFSVGAAVGTADSEQALAVGFSARATENTVVKASVSNDSQHNFVTGAGVSYGW